MNSGLILSVLALASLGLAQEEIWIESPKVTNWGEFGEEELCNSTTSVTAFRLKVQTDQGVLDDTALNSVELHCTPDAGSGAPRHVITSREGIKGNWGTIFECPPAAIAVGFEMRTEEPTLFDNTAANNLRLICSQGSEETDTVLEGIGMDWGDWTGALHCPRGMKICGLRVQVEDPVTLPQPKGGTGVNNVDMLCCDI